MALLKALGWLSEQLLTYELQLQTPVSVAKLGTVGDNGYHQAMTKQHRTDRQQEMFNFTSHVDKRAE